MSIKNMPLDDKTMDGAFEIYGEFGPNLRVPRKERLAKAYPSLSSEEIDDLLNQMKKVDGTVWSVAELGGEPKLGKQKVAEALQAKHPFLRNGGLARASFLATYYAWHEGYAK
jgi:hypothetical protein